MKPRWTWAALLVLASAAISLGTASAALAVKIAPAGDKIQLKATNVKFLIFGNEGEGKYTTCEESNTSGKIGSLGALPVSLETPVFGKGAGDCSIWYFPEEPWPGRAINAEPETLEATSKTEASIGHPFFELQLESGAKGSKEIDEKCQLRMGESTYPMKGVWKNGSIKEKVVTPSTFTVTKFGITVQSLNKCALWGKYTALRYVWATFTVTDVTNPSKVVTLE
ncbi:MAG TPA: hypothetical protein VK655_04875 [Solirubrobacteraceae bacterium]|jgi:hypothetical protein|nr:hypothetical protein [Solirubrobacteraceae bacterium]